MSNQWMPLEGKELVLRDNGDPYADFFLKAEAKTIYVHTSGRFLAAKLPDNIRVCELIEIDVPQPDWSQVPDWIEWEPLWHAIDNHGSAHWYEQEPKLGTIGWRPSQGRWAGDRTYHIPIGIDWRTLKQQRPQGKGEKYE